jgi:hypothetical protein
METIVPLAASTVCGPLGVAHLPRLWLKAVLAAAGLLPEDYLSGYAGTDRDVIDGIGLDAPGTFAYLVTLPSYQDFEVWVRANATRLDAAPVAELNAKIAGRRRKPERAAASRAALGLDGSDECRAALLNALDDWASVYERAVSRTSEPVVPAVSSQSVGPLGLMHLPRFWMKATLDATGALYDGWRSGRASGFDCAFAAQVGLDLDAAIAHVHAETPPYPRFEAWFVAHVDRAGPAEIAAHNAAFRARQKPADIAAEERGLLGIDDPSYRPSIEINDLIDWRELHRIAGAAAAQRL